MSPEGDHLRRPFRAATRVGWKAAVPIAVPISGTAAALPAVFKNSLREENETDTDHLLIRALEPSSEFNEHPSPSRRRVLTVSPEGDNLRRPFRAFLPLSPFPRAHALG
jgi:hypothetical protein